MNNYDPVRRLQEDISKVAAYSRGRADETAGRIDQLVRVIEALKGQRSGAGTAPGVVRVEDIPGRRVPFTLLMDIPIPSNTTTTQQQSVTISQEGPFVAVRRMATFMSALEYQVQVPDQSQNMPPGPLRGGNPRFVGRSFGRYRPIHSAWDIMDAQHNDTAGVDAILLAIAAGFGGAAPFLTLAGFPSFPASASSFRTMEFDGRLAVINAGSSYPRQNISVPSSMWTTEINSPFDLGALDFFERGETLTVFVTPNHVNNPPAGNVTGEFIFNFGSTPEWPFVDGQYDPHEGIATPVPIDFSGGGDPVLLTTDPVSRLPDGLMTVGWEGYRIIQPVAP
jgi:hypothetical protein